MASVDLNQFKALYIKTAQEYLQSMIANLQQLEQNPVSTESRDALHLAAHSLKSQSLVMGYTTTGELCHEIEMYSRVLQEGNKPFPLQHLSQLKQAIASIRQSLDTITANGEEQNLSEAISAFRQGVAA